MSEEIIYPAITVIENNSRFKVVATFSAVLVNYLKTIEGRYYDFQLKQWSFPNDSWDNLQAFLEERNFNFILVKAENYVTITKTKGSLLLKFAAYQPDFKFLSEIKDATYDRKISMYVIPYIAQKELEKILKDNHFVYHINEQVQSIFSSLKRTKENEEQGPSKKQRGVQKEDQETLSPAVTATDN
jgi:uncharacterized protein YlbG (UPF0298 family)